ncbi:MAG: 3'-5' exonuclease [Kiritimatiellales bacterium]|nr:3'-5' exonuclease [Kiritimatiellota bacterium]MBL7012597.1 3'-5' exonuclease [Kiritimatiellales bacterium]
MLIRETTLTVLDFETTGSVPGFDTEPWQIGAVLLRNGQVTSETFESLICVDANRPFNAYAPGDHHKRRDEIATAPGVSKVWKNLEGWVTARPLVAHNAAVEKKFLRQMAPMHRFGPWVDTLKLARQAWPDVPSHKLEDLIHGLGLISRVRNGCPVGRPHDALYDAVACAVLLEHLLAQPSWENLEIS